jgi:GDP-mannose 6-dehydrogenase
MHDSIESVLDHAEVVVIGNSDPQFTQISASLRPGQKVIDLVRLKDWRGPQGQYEGLCW